MTTNIFQDGDIDRVLEALDDKIVRTDQGSYIKVDDLRDFQRQVREMKEEDDNRPKPKTFAQARAMAMADPDMKTTPEPPRAPALSSVKGVNDREA